MLESFFGPTLPDPPSTIHGDFLTAFDQSHASTDPSGAELIAYLDLANTRVESFSDNFGYLLLKACGFDVYTRSVISNYPLTLHVGGQSKSAKSDICVIDLSQKHSGTQNHTVLMVQENKKADVQ